MNPDEDTGNIAAELNALRAEQARIRQSIGQGDLKFRHLARSVFRVTEQERRRLARELHDGVGQKLGSVLHRLSRLEQSDSISESLLEQVLTSTQLVRDCLHEIREISRLMRPQILDDLGLVPALEWLLRTMSQTHGFTVTADLQDPGLANDDDLGTLLFRVAQESLNNIGKHAGATEVVFRLGGKLDRITLLIADNGVGCDLEAALAKGSDGESTGLSAMRERVQLFGGHIDFRSAPSDGMQVRVSIPRSESSVVSPP